MNHPATVTVAGHERSLLDLSSPVDPDALLPATLPDDAPWHVEIGFGKGRYLLQQAIARPEERFLGIEMVGKYSRLLATRAARHGVKNLAVIRGEALYLLAAALPQGFADTVHVYFPDPWPKSKHHRRRLFDAASVDLVLGVLAPGGSLIFATDFLRYGEDVAALLARTPSVAHLERTEAPWPDGARTNYEAKYIREGRPIIRLVATSKRPLPACVLHPDGQHRILAATAPEPADGGS
jgi:tRNA (guanine-N7-)-methyltransferase